VHPRGQQSRGCPPSGLVPSRTLRLAPGTPRRVWSARRWTGTMVPDGKGTGRIALNPHPRGQQTHAPPNDGLVPSRTLRLAPGSAPRNRSASLERQEVDWYHGTGRERYRSHLPESAPWGSTGAWVPPVRAGTEPLRLAPGSAPRDR